MSTTEQPEPEISGIAETLQFMEGKEVETPEAPEPEPEVPEEPTAEEFSELTAQFLEHVPEADRAIVQKYVSPWDAGAQRKFKEYQSAIQAYEELGDLETLARSRFLHQQISDDPQGFRDTLDRMLQQEQPGQTRPVTPPALNQRVLDNLEPEQQAGIQALVELIESRMGDRFQSYESSLQQVNRFLQGLEGRFTTEDQTKQQAVEEEKLAEELKLLEKQYQPLGKFDQDFVLQQVANGMQPDEAVQSYFTLRKSILTEAKVKQPGPTLGSGGLPPVQEEPDYGELTPKQTRDLVEAYLKQSMQEE